jgi:hypothetical protein
MGFFSSKPKEKEPETITFVSIFVCLCGTWCDLTNDPNCTIENVPVLNWYEWYRYWQWHLNSEQPPLKLVWIYYNNFHWLLPTTAFQVRTFTRLKATVEKERKEAAEKAKQGVK